MTTHLTWTGASRHGNPVAGATEDQTPMQLVRALYDAGRKWATVKDEAGNIVGAVGKVDGKRTWWAEA